MADFEIDLTGMESLQDTIDDLKDDVEGERVYVVGSDVEYAAYLEYGTEKMPPYSWFRPAIREFNANPENFIVDNTEYPSVDAIPSVDAFVTAVAIALQSQMENNVSAASSTDRSPGVDPEHPKRDTGTLVNSISAQRIQ